MKTEKNRPELSSLDNLAIWITEHVGSIGFFIIIFIWTFSWLSWNIFAPNNLKFDPFPGFVLWLFISNMIQIFLMPLIMIGQNLQNKQSQIKAASDFEISQRREIQIQTVINHLENQNKMVLEILEKK